MRRVYDDNDYRLHDPISLLRLRDKDFVL